MDVRLVWNVYSLAGFADGTRQVVSEGAHRVPQRSVRYEVSVTPSVCYEVSVTPGAGGICIFYDLGCRL